MQSYLSPLELPDHMRQSDPKGKHFAGNSSEAIRTHYTVNPSDLNLDQLTLEFRIGDDVHFMALGSTQTVEDPQAVAGL